MCTVLVLRGFHPDHPILVAANRDELRDRKFSPPGLFVGRRRRILSPKDRRAGGTWMGVNDLGMVAALTNVASEAPVVGATSRGELPHLALDSDGPEAAVAAVASAVSRGRFSGFRLVVVDAHQAWLCAHVAGEVRVSRLTGDCLAWSNDHAVGELEVPGLQRVLGPVQSAEHRLELLRPLLLRDGTEGGHAMLKRGPDYGTVSSSLVAVAASGPADLVWRFAAGPPDQAPYRNYGNLGRRLLPED